jgi:UDP-glucose 4-epimerase
MNVFVTGGAGYIGSVVTAELLRAGHFCTVFDNLTKGHRAAVPAAAEIVVGDIGDRAALDRAFAARRYEGVMHFAAAIDVGESTRLPERYFRNNSANSLLLLEAMQAAGIERFVFSSTAALFGEPERVPIEEGDALRPTNPYGESKLIVERMLPWFNQVRGLHYASLRYFNAAGASREQGEAHDPETHLIPLVLQVALGSRPSVAIYGVDYPTRDGTCIRDYIHVVDLAQAHVLALEALAQRDRLIYNLGNGAGFSVREVIEVARRVTGKPIAAIDSPRRPGDPAVLVASSARIRRELGWTPRHADLECIVGSAWEWLQRHPNGYASYTGESA